MSEQHNFLEGALAEETAKYLVHTRAEISQILRSVMRDKGIVTGYFNKGQSFFLSIILDVDPKSGQLVIDCGPDPEINARALNSDRFVFVTNQNHIRVQFRGSELKESMFEGQPAFSLQLPPNLLRLQRRKYYRMATPVSTPLLCIVPDLAGGRVETTVTDISVGGVAISGFPPGVALTEGFLLPNCRICLPEEGTVVTTLRIRNLRRINKGSRQDILLAGCAFTGIPGQHQAIIQRYITRTDLERRAQNRYL